MKFVHDYFVFEIRMISWAADVDMSCAGISEGINDMESVVLVKH